MSVASHLSIHFPDGSYIKLPTSQIPAGDFHGWDGAALLGRVLEKADDFVSPENVISLAPKSGSEPEHKFGVVVTWIGDPAQRYKKAGKKAEPTDDGQTGWATSRRPTKLHSCRLVLSIAHRLLPGVVRQDYLDEWLDDVGSAAEAGRPVVKRTLSVLLRALPKAVLYTWRPKRVKQEQN